MWEENWRVNWQLNEFHKVIVDKSNLTSSGHTSDTGRDQCGPRSRGQHPPALLLLADRPSPRMVEKKAFQTHHRNISSVSAVSDISVSIDPIKREDGAEIKVIFLLESDKERNMMMEVIQKSLLDGQSDIQRPCVYNHRWEQFHTECTGSECPHCIRSPTIASEIKKGHFRRGSADTDVFIQPQVKNWPFKCLVSQAYSTFSHILCTNLICFPQIYIW